MNTENLPVTLTESISAPPSAVNILSFDDRTFGRAMQLAEMMATAPNVVPKHFAGQKGSCLAIICQAMRWNMDPFAVAQKTHVINGVIGYEAQLVNAILSSMSAIKGRPKFEWFGPWDKVRGKKSASDIEEAAGVKVAVTSSDGNVIEHYITLSQASVRNSPLWETDPKQQLAYLVVKRMARLYFPDALMGVYTPDELIESGMRDVSPTIGETARDRLSALEQEPDECEAVGADALLKRARVEADETNQTVTENEPPDFTGWAEDAWRELQSMLDPMDVDDWVTRNADTISSFTKSDPEKALKFRNSVADRRRQLGGL